MRTTLPAADPAARPPARWRSVLVRTVVFAVLWWVLAEGVRYGWGLAALSIAAAVWASLALLPPGLWRLRTAGLLRFVPFFLWQSARGGIDVASRALHPRLPIEPGELLYPVRLPDGPSRTFFTASLSLLPGTVSLEARDDHLLIHTLDRRMDSTRTLERLEGHVAAMFGEEPRTAG